jgi:hypothetical protein
MTTLGTYKVLPIRIGHILSAGRAFWEIGGDVHAIAVKNLSVQFSLRLGSFLK